jgi:hypothetical protein
MAHNSSALRWLLGNIDFGSSVAESDQLLESARVETSVFSDLLNDKVDLVPGTKGSGKSALYRIFVDFLPQYLLNQKKVVVAHGVQRHGDEVFHAYNDEFERMDENVFVSFWCVYLVSLANEHFVKQPRYETYLRHASDEVAAFRRSCQVARIPDFDKPKTLKDVLGWVLAVLNSWRPKVKYKPPHDVGEFEFDLLGREMPKDEGVGKDPGVEKLPRYVHDIKESLEAIVGKSGLGLWLMIDRLDEIFPRRSELETRALRGLLRTLRIFESDQVRVKVFLRDDILDQVVSGSQGFTALTHVTARKADTLRWSEDQILTMIVKRLFANDRLTKHLKVDTQRLEASQGYQKECFYLVFPQAVDRGSRRSTTLRWIYNHTADGRGVVTPRDVIDLLTAAKQRQLDLVSSNPSSSWDCIITPTAIRYGHGELSRHKKTTFLLAEFPHYRDSIQNFVGGKTEYSNTALRRVLGKDWEKVTENLGSIGLLRKESKRDGSFTYKIPFLFREGLEVTQGHSD